MTHYEIIQFVFKQHRITITGYFIFGAVLVISFFLYQLPLAAVLYPMALCFLIGSGLMAADFRHAAKTQELAEISKLTSQLMNDLPPCRFHRGKGLSEDHRNAAQGRG